MSFTVYDLKCPICIETDGELIFYPAGNSVPLSNGETITADFDLFRCMACDAVISASNVFAYNGQSADEFINIDLSAVAGDSSVSLTWELLNIEQASAEIYRSESDDLDDATLISSITDTTLSYTDTTAINDTTYYYCVLVTDANSDQYESIMADATPTVS